MIPGYQRWCLGIFVFIVASRPTSPHIPLAGYWHGWKVKAGRLTSPCRHVGIGMGF